MNDTEKNKTNEPKIIDTIVNSLMKKLFNGEKVDLTETVGVTE